VDQEKERETAEHIISVAGTVGSSYGSDRCEQELGCDINLVVGATFS